MNAPHGSSSTHRQRQRAAPIPAPADSPGVSAVEAVGRTGVDASSPATANDSLTWDYRIPLLTDRFLMWDLVRVLGAGFGFVVLLMAVAITLEGGWSWPAAISLAKGLGITAVVLAMLAIFATLVVMGNRSQATFVLDHKGATYAAGRKERALNRIAVLAGFLTGRPGVAGAGLISMGREVEHYDWRDIHRVSVHRRERVISLSDSWHTVMRLYCPGERFDEIVEFVTARAAEADARRAAAARRAGQPPLQQMPYRAWLVWTSLVLVGTVTALAWPWASDLTGWSALVAGLFVLLAGLVSRGLQRPVALLGAGSSLIVLVSLIIEALDPIHSPSGAILGFGWELGTQRLLIASSGAVLLLGLALWRLIQAKAVRRSSTAVGDGHPSRIMSRSPQGGDHA